MPVKTIEIQSNFIGDFKVGDNLVYNSSLLCKLAEAGSVYNKLIVVQIGSIIEAALSQIFYRARSFTREGVPNILEADRAEIEKKTVEKFAVIIDVSKKYKLLDDLGADVYDELHKLRKYRNKVHIQAEFDIASVPRDEEKAYSDIVRSWAFGLNVKILEFLGKKYPRPEGLGSFVQNLTVPSC
ncbi:hypothetical protein [Bradyrhizobium sp. S69]|uniref:hypothetical protein n=1 Tax=Bradyrhizobium sp. S69 TaxID=1641856 RepID=UPI00131CB680|nr:hypothetical protein [Bradyrhizobium sp. S69]